MINPQFKKDIILNALVFASWAIATIVAFVVTANGPMVLAIVSDLFMVVALTVFYFNLNKNLKHLKKASQLIEYAPTVKLKVTIHPRGRTSYYLEPHDERREYFLQGEMIDMQSAIPNFSINNTFVDIYCDSGKVVVIKAGENYLWGLRVR